MKKQAMEYIETITLAGTKRYCKLTHSIDEGIPRIVEYDPKTGKPIWEINILGDKVIKIPNQKGLAKLAKENP